MESYCGKNCMQCPYFIQRCCPGCKWGPGQPARGVCPLARCCREKGHGSCRACSMAYNCGLLAQRDSFPPRPASNPAPPHQVHPAPTPSGPPPTVENAAILARWLGWLFFLELAQIVVAVLLGLFITSFRISSIPFPVSVASNLLSTFLYCVPYFRLSEAQPSYRIPAICHVALFPFSIAVAWFTDEKSPWYIFFSLVYYLFMLIVEGLAYRENEKAVQGLSGRLAQGWKYLYRALIPLTVILFFGGLLCVIDFSLGVGPVLLALLGLAIMCIADFVFRYQTVNTLLRYVSAAEQTGNPSP